MERSICLKCQCTPPLPNKQLIESSLRHSGLRDILLQRKTLNCYANMVSGQKVVLWSSLRSLMSRIHGVAAGTRLSSTAASVPHSPLVGFVAQLIRDTRAAAGTNPPNPSPLVLMWQKHALSVESCMRPNQPCTGSGMATRLSTHQAVVRNMLNITILTQHPISAAEKETLSSFRSSLDQLLSPFHGQLSFFNPLVNPKPKTECSKRWY